jgi:hypothetical protein
MTESTRANPELPRWLTLGVPHVLAIGTALLALAWPESIRLWYAGELGLLENLEVLALFAALYVGLLALASRAIRAERLKTAWVAMFVLGLFYITGEEISWGQHYFGWGTPEWYQAVNDQQETNLHNTSDWLDQKPRALLEFAIYFSSLFYPLLARVWRPRWLERLPAWTWPTRVCLPAALLILLAQVFDKTALGPLSQGIGLRLSEVREFLVYFYLYIYIYSLYRRRDRLPT